MKNYFTLFLLFMFFSLHAQYHIDWANAPMNPIPMVYTLNHFNLEGPIKSMQEKISSFEMIYNFNEAGRISQTGGTFGELDYSYDAKGFIVGLKSTSYASNIKNNDLGFVIEEKWTNQNLAGQTIYEYNEKGLFSKKTKTSSKGSTITHFTYDDLNRIIKEESLQDGVVFETIKYTYTMEENLLKTDKTIAKGNATPSFLVQYFDSRGEVSHPMLGYTPVYDGYQNKLFDSGMFDAIYNMRMLDYFLDVYCNSGNCVNGWGVLKGKNGTYEGFFLDAKREGFGQYTWTDGSQYAGSWSNDVMEGFGKYQSTSVTIFGVFKNNKLHGNGYKIINGNSGIGIYENDLLKMQYTYEITGKVTGCIAGDCESKFGKIILANGDLFEGFFSNGKMLFGDFQMANGDAYQGQFGTDGTFTGIGQMIKKDGSYYGGMFSKSKLNGKSYYKNPSGTAILVGEWEKGKFVKAL